MNQIPLFNELLVVSCFGVFITIIVTRFKLPMIAGLLLTGILVGPYGLKLIDRGEDIQALADLGVTLLLFSIGLEFPVRRLLRVFKVTALGGLIQVGLTVAWVTGAMFLMDNTLSRGILFGMIIALSSTAIVMSLLSSRNDIDSPHGRLTVGILIFQDLCVIPMLLIVPALAGKNKEALDVAILSALGTATLVILITLLVARKLIPMIFHAVDATRARETFLLAVIGLCLGTTWITSRYGLSASLGAFLAGVILADSDFGDRAMSDILPLRSAFMSIFFIALGMLLNFNMVLEKPLQVGMLLLAFLLGKGLVGALAALAIGFPARIAWLTGLCLAQFGEFGFVLAKLGHSVGLIGHNELEIILAAGVFSMLVTPVAMALGPHFQAGEIILRPLEKLLGVRGISEPAPEHEHVSNHIVVAGFGIGGKILADGLKKNGVSHLVLELNAEKVLSERAKGVPIYYGDITSMETMKHAGLNRAKALVLLINDPVAAKRAVCAVRDFAPHLKIFLRSRYFSDWVGLKTLGADYVVTEEFESAVKMTSEVLEFTGCQDVQIAAFVTNARAEYEPGQ